MASAGGSAKLVYPGGCQVRVIPGTVVSIGKQPPCTAPYDVRYNPPPHLFNNPLVPFAIGGAIGWGIFRAVEYCRDDDGGGEFPNQLDPERRSACHYPQRNLPSSEAS